MATPHQLDILDSASEAMRVYLFNCTVAIFTSEVSSGTCIVLEDRYFVATVAHTLRHCRKDKIAIVSSKEFSEKRVEIRDVKFLYDDTTQCDVGFLELEKEVALSLGKNFIGLDSLNETASNLEKEVIAVAGFPASKTKKKHLDFDFGMTTFVTVGKSEGDWDAGINKSVQFEIAYPKQLLEHKKTKPTILPDAPGISGGGVWLTELTLRHQLWSPDKAKLIGINTSWHPGKRWIRANRISEWLKLVK